ncbi:hypothetical protein COV61_03970 [Candidatus Micrarchaeota archaeon CG11_big_fil_rev_8_21_14_0_20_47_5]|nr:MAG: hypothetical protein AUJ17_00040 [Candidatus Micrarchaeota archaeon CG1_02_47_40]PIN83136.1 MAG: hypothetical protein COV61_03970 [Candidatus Micrarchaeota archaeon CG11_big_fil_rev_8_21_14_0_20_47_5]
MGKAFLFISLLALASIFYSQLPSGQGGPAFSGQDLDRMIAAQQNNIQMVKSCQAASFAPPVSDAKVSKIDILGLVDGKCKIILHTDNGEAQYLLSESIYKSFSSINDVEKGECSGACESSKSAMQAPETEDEGELCMRECIVKDCDLGEFACQKLNGEKCEKECDMLGDAPELESMSKEQRCISECVSREAPGTRCGGGPEGETGNEICQKCASECVHLYEGPCLGEEKLEEKKKACFTCEHCYGAPVMGPSGEGYDCIVDVKCSDASGEWGDNPGTGPDSYEAGHEPGASYEASLELWEDKGTLLIETENSGQIGVDIAAKEGISLRQEGGKLLITTTGEDAQTEQIEIDNNLKDVMFSPEGKQLNIEKITVGVENDKPVYEFEEKEKAKLFGLIPIDKNVKKKVDAENLELLEKKEPWWGFLALEE